MTQAAESRPYIAQIWIVPAVQLQNPVTIPGTPAMSMRNVDIDFQTFRGVATLLETDGTQTDMQDSSPDMARIGEVLSRLSFSLLIGFNILAARVVPKGLVEGQQTDEIIYPGPPPGISLFEQKVGFRRHGSLDLEFLRGDLQPEVEGAITWFLAGLFSPNSVYQVLNHWIGLEMLAPAIEGPWHCQRCDQDIASCPNCKEGTEEPRATRSIREFLRRELGISRKEFEDLSELRNAIAHGRLYLDQGGIQEAGKRAIRIQALLLRGIKKRLGWPNESPPSIGAEGITITGTPGLEYAGNTVGKGFYDKFHD